MRGSCRFCQPQQSVDFSAFLDNNDDMKLQGLAEVNRQILPIVVAIEAAKVKTYAR